MSRMGLIVVVLFLNLGVFTAQAQSSESEYLTVLDTLSTAGMREAIYGAQVHGFNLKNYWSEAMESGFQRNPNDPELKQRTKLNFLRLMVQMNAGIVDPGVMGEDVAVKRKAFLTAEQLRAVILAQGSWAVGTLQAFVPRHAQYRGLQTAYARLYEYCGSGQWQNLPSMGRSLKLGSQDKSVPAIKERLRQLGYRIASIDEVYDKTTEEAVRDVQWTLRSRPDGVISAGGPTYRHLNVGCNERLREMRVNMDKLRWLPQDIPDRHIFVNLAMTYLTLTDPQAGVSTSMKTIVGRPARTSPTMVDKIVYAVINPYWVVPPTIFREDKLADIKGLTPQQIDQYFARNNYQVWNKDFTRKYIPSSVNWWALRPEDDKELYIRQMPSTRNALGRVKFMMTNSLAIYLHDTNQPELFKEPQRQLSSGCVRVERPVDLAEILLQGTDYNRAKIEETMAKPGQVMKTDTRVNLKAHMPVYMVYLTAQMSSDGILRFTDDSYGQMNRMLRNGAW